MATALADRIDAYASPLVRYPLLTQLAGLAGSGVMAANGGGAASALPWLVQAGLRRAEINHLSNKYQDTDEAERGSLRRARQSITDPLTLSGSHRLGQTLSYLAMAGKSPTQPMISELSDPLSLTLPGYGAIVAPVIDNISASHLLHKHSAARKEEEEARPRRRMVPLSDPRSNSVLPAMLAALAGSVGGGLYASKKLLDFTDTARPTKGSWTYLPNVSPLYRKFFGGEREDIVQRVANRHIPVYDIQNADGTPFQNAFYSNRGAPFSGKEFIGLGNKGFASSSILAHEAGHGKVESTKDIVQWLQRNAYQHMGKTTALSPVAGLGAGMLAGGAGKGMLAGALTGGVLNAGYLLPEHMASVYARKGLRNDKGGYDHGLDSKALWTALGTYAAAGLLPSTIAGGLGGLITGARKKRQAEQGEVKEAANRVTRLIQAGRLSPESVARWKEKAPVRWDPGVPVSGISMRKAATPRWAQLMAAAKLAPQSIERLAGEMGGNTRRLGNQVLGNGSEGVARAAFTPGKGPSVIKEFFENPYGSIITDRVDLMRRHPDLFARVYDVNPAHQRMVVERLQPLAPLGGMYHTSAMKNRLLTKATEDPASYGTYRFAEDGGKWSVRDIRDANIGLTAEGVPKVMDPIVMGGTPSRYPSVARQIKPWHRDLTMRQLNLANSTPSSTGGLRWGDILQDTSPSAFKLRGTPSPSSQGVPMALLEAQAKLHALRLELTRLQQANNLKPPGLMQGILKNLFARGRDT